MKTKTLFILTLLLFSNYLMAHSALKSTSPSNDEMLNKSPENISLTFLNPVKLIKFELISPEQKKVDTDFKASMADRMEYSINPGELSNGLYTVLWAFMGPDGHKMKGEFQFKVMQMDEMEDHGNHSH